MWKYISIFKDFFWIKDSFKICCEMSFLVILKFIKQIYCQKLKIFSKTWQVQWAWMAKLYIYWQTDWLTAPLLCWERNVSTRCRVSMRLHCTNTNQMKQKNCQMLDSSTVRVSSVGRAESLEWTDQWFESTTRHIFLF